MSNIRDIRLIEDYKKIQQLVKTYPFINLEKVKGNPPTSYQLSYNLTGYINKSGKTADKHLLEVSIPEQYPFAAPPKFHFPNKLFHPNVYRSGDVCHGWYLTNWKPTIHISDMLIDIARMIAFKPDAYNIQGAANLDCDENWINAHQIPTDNTPIQTSQLHTPSLTNKPVAQNNTANKSDATLKIKLTETKTTATPTPKKEPLRIQLKN